MYTYLVTYDDCFYLHTMIFLLTYVLRYSSKLKELIPQIRVTSYASIDVNNKIGLHTEKQRQITLINVIENRYFQCNKTRSFQYTRHLLTYDDPLIQRLCVKLCGELVK